MPKKSFNGYHPQVKVILLLLASLILPFVCFLQFQFSFQECHFGSVCGGSSYSSSSARCVAVFPQGLCKERESNAPAAGVRTSAMSLHRHTAVLAYPPSPPTSLHKSVSVMNTASSPHRLFPLFYPVISLLN
jgi:hypothetical protein